MSGDSDSSDLTQESMEEDAEESSRRAASVVTGTDAGTEDLQEEGNENVDQGMMLSFLYSLVFRWLIYSKIRLKDQGKVVENPELEVGRGQLPICASKENGENSTLPSIPSLCTVLLVFWITLYLIQQEKIRWVCFALHERDEDRTVSHRQRSVIVHVFCLLRKATMVRI